jgi:PhzF family phenazine biosynthesis protein
LEEWLPTEVMQHLANENNFSETAFFVKEEDIFYLRWFTPEVEIDLSGHPTLATAFVIFQELGYNKDIIQFESKSGPLYVGRQGDLIIMNFPSCVAVKYTPPEALLKGINIQPQQVLKSRDYILVYKNEDEVRNFVPDFEWLNKVETPGILVKAQGNETDFVSSFFVPNSTIGEDPVTGSAHATLIPYWSKILDKNSMMATQVSKRGGLIWCEDKVKE